jgi:hypothetical protein
MFGLAAVMVALAALAWQVAEARRRRTPRVRVDVQHAALPDALPDGPELLEQPLIGQTTQRVVWPATEPLAYVLVAMAVNHGETLETVEDLRLVTVADKMGCGANPGEPGRPLPPGERVSWALRPDHSALDFSEGFHFEAILGRGTVVRSAPCYLDQSVIEVGLQSWAAFLGPDPGAM